VQPWSDFRLVNYVIHDGHRVGLFDEYVLHNQPNASALGELQKTLEFQTSNTGMLLPQLWDYCAYVVFNNTNGTRPRISAWADDQLPQDGLPQDQLLQYALPQDCLMMESVSNCKHLKASNPEACENGFDLLALALTAYAL
jgi:hypothetical protein